MNKKLFLKEVEHLGIFLTEKQINDLDTYYKLLVSYNEFVNLTAITKEEDVYLKHFYDSLTLFKGINLKENLKICDIGTGAGFPGLVLKIVFPNLSVTLVDSLEKRIKFLDLAIEKLNLKDIKTVHSRIEDYKENELFDVVVSRAVAKINVLLELGCQLSKTGGLFVFMKGNVLEELNNSKNALKVLNYSLENVINFKLPIEESERNIVILKHTSPTSKNYPRQFSTIKKKPL
ncbi:MAG: 16S rRNA (guanine(527)-N(7))-methyltransferase RsmG [Bacilli bacterium]|nr:16S rRNA (guanine(527)-N(7))-methyltransferase RsmG [Mycoplasmatota bacterium]MDY4237234.1 16S rRNA (guanine(527)-N(7))-methyltransferase RsmG [Bacilli bacterium]